MSLTVGGSLAGDAYTGSDPAQGYCEEWGATITGGKHQLSGAVPMPAVVVPAVGVATGAIAVGWGETETIHGDAHYSSVSAAYGSTVAIEGSATIVIDGDFLVDGGAWVVEDGERVDVDVGGNIRTGWGAALNAGEVPSQLRFYSPFGSDVTFDYGASVNALIEAPFSTFANNGTTFSGTVVANVATTGWGATAHLDLARLCP